MNERKHLFSFAFIFASSLLILRRKLIDHSQQVAFIKLRINDYDNTS